MKVRIAVMDSFTSETEEFDIEVNDFSEKEVVCAIVNYYVSTCAVMDEETFDVKLWLSSADGACAAFTFTEFGDTLFTTGFAYII